MSRFKAFALGALLGFGAVTCWELWVSILGVGVKVYDSSDDTKDVAKTPTTTTVCCHAGCPGWTGK
jgi:hypothetical protein